MSEISDRVYWVREPRTLRTVCHKLGRDDDGRACATCALHDLCEKIERGSAPAAAQPQRVPQAA